MESVVSFMQRLVVLLVWLHVVMCSDRVVVTFETSSMAAGVKSIENATIVKQYGRRLVLDLGRPVELPEEWIWEALGWVGVVTIEEDVFVDIAQMVTEVENMPFQWNLADSEPHSIHVEGMWRNTNSTPDVVVAVLDSGLASEATGLFMHLGDGFDFISDPDVGLDGDGRDSDSTDPGDSGVDCPKASWHGTKVSSVLAARHRPEFKGIAQNITLLSIRVLGLCSKGFSNDVADAIVWASGGVINGIARNPRPAKFISMSFAGTGGCPSFLQSAINQAHGLGAVLVVAAGNKGLPSIDNIFPANCVNVTSVGGTTRDGSVASYSNRGASILAPGGDGVDPIPVIGRDLVVEYATGTSFAVPHVVGLAALEARLNSVVSNASSFVESYGNFSVEAAIGECPDDKSYRFDYSTYTIGCYCSAGSYNPTERQDMLMVTGTSPFLQGLVWVYDSMQNYHPAYKNGDQYIWFYVDLWVSGRLEQLGSDQYEVEGFRWRQNLLLFSNDWSFCLPCPAGTWGVAIGILDQAAACPNKLDCAAGTYSASIHQTSAGSCITCSSGTYSPMKGGTTCLQCSAGTTSGPGATYCYTIGSRTAYLGMGTSQTCKWLYYNDHWCSCWHVLTTIWNENNGQNLVTSNMPAVCSSSCDLTYYDDYHYVGVNTDLTWQWHGLQPSTCSQCYQPIYGIPANCNSVVAPIVQQCFYFNACGRSGCYRDRLGAAMCHQCNAGFYSAVPGFTSCTTCAAGTYSTGIGMLDTMEAASPVYSSSATLAGFNSPLLDSASAWSSSLVSGWTRIDLGTVCMVVGFVTQRHASKSEWVIQYSIDYSIDAVSWMNSGEYEGNGDSYARSIAWPVTRFMARYVKLSAVVYNERFSIRWNVLVQSSPCMQCPAGTYAMTGAAVCGSCAAGTYGSGSGLSSCAACMVGTFMATAGSSVCLSCSVGKYAMTGATTCISCAAGTYSSGSGLSSCAACMVGTFMATAGSSVCLSCSVGKYAMTGATTCVSCASGTFASSISTSACKLCLAGTYAMGGATACLACPLGTYAMSSGYSMCISCTVDADTGNYIVCNGTHNKQSSCPVIHNGSYTFNNIGNHVNRCLLWKCANEFYSTPNDAVMVQSLCGLPTQYISPNASCISYLTTVCKPVRQCESSVWLSGFYGAYILDDNNNRRCTPCTSCARGGISWIACNPLYSIQQQCAKCQARNGVVLYEYNGTCVDLLVSPVGYYPYQLSYPGSLVSTITDNSMFSFPIVEMTGASTFTDLVLTADVQLNVFIPCAPPPISRRFKVWGPNSPIPLVCSTFQCADFQHACDLLQSTECIGWNADLKQGWFTGGLGACVACTNVSDVRPCSWGQYGDLTQCTTNRDTQCASCTGTLPGNATWTVSIAPHYYYSNASHQCEWDCIKGFYRFGTQCKACVKADHSQFLDGPNIYNMDSPPLKTCLTPSDCKYFGGTLELQCQWKCSMGYVQVTPNVQGVPSYCVPCPVVSCAAGMTSYPNKDTGCQTCQSCPSMAANATYQADCLFTCNAGFFKNSATSCQSCSRLSCSASQYLVACAGVVDSVCASCLVCPTGQQQVTACGEVTNTQCESCANVLPSNSYYVSGCDISCSVGFIMSDGACIQCRTICPYDMKPSATCTAQNLGCDSCNVPATLNWCWTGLSPCSWDCLIYNVKSQDRCVQSMSKTIGPVCVGPLVLQPVLSSSVVETTAAIRYVTSTATIPIAIISTSTVTIPSAISFAKTATIPGAIRASTVTIPRAISSVIRYATSGARTSVIGRITSNVTIRSSPAAFLSVSRMSIGLDNMTLQQCLCASGQMANRLTASLNTGMFVAACQSVEGIIECINFTCPCSRRLMLSASQSICQMVYQAPPTSQFNSSQIAMALADIGHVTDLHIVVLPLQQLVWDKQLLTWQPEVTSVTADMTVPYVFVILVVIICLAVSKWYFTPSTQVLLVSNTPTNGFGSMIRVKIM